MQGLSRRQFLKGMLGAAALAAGVEALPAAAPVVPETIHFTPIYDWKNYTATYKQIFVAYPRQVGMVERARVDAENR